MINVSKVFKKDSLVQRYKDNTSGNVALVTAISMLVMLGGIALAIDLSRGWAAKERLQDTTDVIALMAAKDGLTSVADLQAAADSLLAVHYPGGEGARLQVLDIKRDGDTVRVETQNNIDTFFAPVLDKDDLDVRVVSTATYANKGMDISLVLDTTGSMQGSKMSSLKSAAGGLIDDLKDLDNDKLRMSVVPFGQYVNVGTSRRNSVWLDVPADETRTRTRRDVIARRNCRTERRTVNNDGNISTRNVRVCDNIYGPEYTQSYDVKWKGCVGSRNTPHDTRAAYNGRKIPGLLGVNCGSELQDLDKNLNKAKQTLNSMTASGNTYMPSGLLWGWRTLDRDMPLPSTAPTGVTDQDRILVLMTDGKNTKSKSGDYHSGNNKNDADSKTRTLCDQIKTDKITVYTIAYEVNDNSTKNLLSNCATDRTKFFDASNASELNKAFDDIADSLKELRITA